MAFALQGLLVLGGVISVMSTLSERCESQEPERAACMQSLLQATSVRGITMTRDGLDSTMTKVMLPNNTYEGGRCLDGSQAGYYYGPPSGSNSSVLVFFLKGGGACGDKAGCDQWVETGQGSSRTWPDNMTGTDTLSSDASSNRWHNAHKVYVPYCTGDTHAGQIIQPTDEQWGYYFDGHFNVKAITHHIFSQPWAASIKRVMFQGTSAGGKGVFMNCDFVQSYLTSLGSEANVSCVPQAAWFYPGFTEDNEDPDAMPTAYPYWIQNQTVPVSEGPAEILMIQDLYLPEDCRNAHAAEPWRCASVHVAYPYIKAPVYVIQDEFDFFQIENQLGLSPDEAASPNGHAFIAYFGRAMRTSTSQVQPENHPFSKHGDGLFLTSCYNHGSSAIMGEVRKWDGLADWFFGDEQLEKIMVDSCSMPAPGLPCGTNCAHAPGTEAPLGCLPTFALLCAAQATSKQACFTCAEDNMDNLMKADCVKDQIVWQCQKLP